MILKRFVIFTFILCVASIQVSYSQKYFKFSGYVKDNTTKLPLAAVSVIIADSKYGTVTDSTGYFEGFVPKGRYMFEFSHQAYFKKFRTVEVTDSFTFEILLDEKSNDLEEVKVSASSIEQSMKRLEGGVSSVTKKNLARIPTLLGEIDVIKSLHTLPGVSSVGDGASGFNVRGGSIDQNLILLDGSPIFNTSHLLGFFSIINPDVFKSYNFNRGGVQSEFGGRTASVLSVQLKEANPQKMQISGGLSTVSSRLFVETPLIKDKLGFYVAGRISYIDKFFNLLKVANLAGTTANFYDLTSKLEFRPSAKDIFAVTHLLGNDNFGLGSDSLISKEANLNVQYNWKTNNVAGTWSRFFNNNFNNRLEANIATYSARMNNTDTLTAFHINYALRQIGLKNITTFTLKDGIEFDAGGQFNRYEINPGELKPTSTFSNKNPLLLPSEKGIEWAVFLQNRWKISDKISTGLGIRYANFIAFGDGEMRNYEAGKPRSLLTYVSTTQTPAGQSVATYGGLEPRFAFNYQYNAVGSVKLSVSRMQQFLQLLSNTTAALPTDRWKLSDQYLKPQIADMVSLGVFNNIRSKSVETSVEFFYKNLSNVVDYKGGETLFMNPTPETALLQGKGLAYGLEVFLKKGLGLFTGWVSYTYSNTLHQISGPTPEETINNGQYFRPIYNRPHSFNAVASYKQSKRVLFTSNFTFSSGRAITYPASKYYFSGVVVPHYNSRNESQIPNYVRLDLAMNLEENTEKTKGIKSSWSFAVYNVLGRKNAYSIFFRNNLPVSQYDAITDIFKLSVLGSMIPSITYNFRF